MSAGLSKKEVKISVILIGIILAEKVLSFAKNIVFAYYFGAQSSTDLYYLSTNIVSLFNICFCVSIPTAFLTYFINQGLREQEGKEQAKVMSNVISTFLVLSVVFTGILFLIAPVLEWIIAPTESTDINERLSVYIRILSFIVILYCLSGMFSSFLECLGDYVTTKLSSLFVSFTAVLAAVFFGAKYGTIAAVYGFLAGIGCHAVFSYVRLRSKRIIRIGMPHYDHDVKAVLRLSLPMMISVATVSVNSLVDKLIAVKLGEGTVSALNYGSLLSRELITGILVAAIGSIVTARFSENVLHKEFEALNANLNTVIFLMQLAVIPLTIFFLGNANAIIGFVFEHGAFDAAAKELTVTSFVGYSIGLVFIPFREVFIRVQYAYQDSKRPMIVSIICVALNVVLSIVLGLLYGIIGISVATSVATIVNCFLSFFMIKKTNVVKIALDYRMYGKLFISSGLTILLVIIVENFIQVRSFLGLSVWGLMIFTVFNGLSFIMNRERYKEAIRAFRNRKD